MELNGFSPNPSYALRSPPQMVAADAAFGAGASKSPVENSAQSSGRRPEPPRGTPPPPSGSLPPINGTAPPPPGSSSEKAAHLASSATAEDEEKSTRPGATGTGGEPLTKEQESQVRELKKRDAEVKAHEQAHAAVGGSYASAPTYTYTKGPDGKKYAIGGEVQIDTSPERTPDATIRKMDIVVAAALAPADPSAQDRAVARQAQQQRLEAQNQRAEQQAAERAERSGDSDEAEASGETTGLDNGLLAQIITQAEEASNSGETDDGAPSNSATAKAAAASAAYGQAASLAAQIFGDAGA